MYNVLKDRSVIFLIAVNLLPLIGVFIFDWDAIMIVIFYCAETFIVGIFNILKMIRSEAEIPQEHLQKTAAQAQEVNTQLASNPGCVKGILIPFFFVHYNGFVVVQTVMIILISNQFSEQKYELNDFLDPEFLINLLLLVFSHAYSFKKNYLGKEEYKKVSVSALMFFPYKRVIVQQFTVILGTFLIIFFQGPVGYLILLLLLKIFFDVRAHNRAHEKLSIVAD